MTDLSADQKRLIFVIVSLFETDKLPSPAAYSSCSILGDKAGITYGIHQCTAHRGTLSLVVAEYERLGGARSAYLIEHQHIIRASVSVSPKSIPPEVARYMEELRLAGSDPVMQQAQEVVFNAHYWQPAHKKWTALKLSEPLSLLALYDCTIQSGIGRIDMLRDHFAELPPSKGGAERPWTRAFIEARQAWLAAFVGKDDEHTRLVRRSVYRTQALLELAQLEEGWKLRSPLTVRGKKI